MNDDCLICLESMCIEDSKYPLLCPTQCGFNMCMNCLRDLLESSKSGYEEASDGNLAVKIRLQCPQCRGDLSYTIQDTLLCRRYETNIKKWNDIPDSELTGNELRDKYGIDETSLFHAQERLQQFSIEVKNKKNSNITATTRKETKDDSLSSQNELCHNRSNNSRKEEFLMMDNALFRGLHLAMTDQEKKFISELMTSGDTNQLAQGAQILGGISDLVCKRRFQPIPTANGVRDPKEQKFGIDIYDESQCVLLQIIGEHRRKHPLPARMPIFLQLETTFDPYTSRGKILKFVDADEWDGTVANAFALAFSQNNKKEAENHHSHENKQTKNRVLVLMARGNAAKLGIQKGDVVTHVNGEPFYGNAEDLRQIIKKNYECDSQMFSLVVNANEATAQALLNRGTIDGIE